jgi:sugar/nucleoside kinase (ribokinase family)
VVVGNVVEDRAPGGGWMPGGPALYSACTAAGLGADVTLVTRLHPRYDRSVLGRLDIIALAAASAPRYANSYSPSRRVQELLHPGEAIDALPGLPRADGVMFAPAYHELDALLANGPPATVQGAVLGYALQGMLRTTGAGGRVHPRGDATAAAAVVPEGAFAFFSDEDTADPDGLGRYLAGRGTVALCTRGEDGAVLYGQGGPRLFPALPAALVDPTGAGDCFAAAFIVRFIETRDLDAAARFACAAGAVAVEGFGLEGIPSRAAVESRLAEMAA